jgi:hypothetical protein
MSADVLRQKLLGLSNTYSANRTLPGINPLSGTVGVRVGLMSAPFTARFEGRCVLAAIPKGTDVGLEIIKDMFSVANMLT